MTDVIQIQLWQFSLIYILLIIVGIVMKACKINKLKLLTVASIRMSVQLVLAGLILGYIFQNPKPLYTILYLTLMTGFAIYQILSKNKEVNFKFKCIVAACVAITGISVLVFFIYIVVGETIFNPQYVIPIAGMIMGNTMTGITLGIKTFRESLTLQRAKVNTLLAIGATPKVILLPLVKQALETAMLPTLYSMIGMGIVSLPGMMTGQILSGTMPMTSILYQIAIMIAICTVVTMACFSSLYIGYKTFYDKDTLTFTYETY